MNELTQTLYSKLPLKSQTYVDAVIRKLFQEYTGQIRLNCHMGTITKMQEVKDAE